MSSFRFFDGLNLSFKIYSITDNLSKTFQAESISAVESQETAALSIKTLKRKRNQADADAFHESTKMKAKRFDFVEHPTLPRKRKTPNYKILEQYFVVDGLPQGAEAHHTSNSKEHYRQMYYEVLDSIITVIEDRFDQKSFQVYLQMESLLLKQLDGACVKREIELLNENYKNCKNILYNYIVKISLENYQIF